MATSSSTEILLRKPRNTVFSGEHVVEAGLIIAYGDATIIASKNATVILFDRAVAHISDTVHCTARDAATVHAHGSAEVVLGNGAFLWAYDQASFIANDDSTVWAYGQSEGYLFGRAAFHGHDQASALSTSTSEPRLHHQAVVEKLTPQGVQVIHSQG